jgi:glycosyltransferase involved in cell wall biosynthesis
MPSLPKHISDCKIALIYDRVTTKHGGAEKVLGALHELFPQAPLFTTVYNKENTPWANTIAVIPSWLQKIPFAKYHHRWLLPLIPLAFENFDLTQYDIVISITSAEAKGVITQPQQLHLCYLLTPTRYLYSHQQTYLNASKKTFPGLQYLVSQFFRYISWWDTAASARPDYLVPISDLIAKRTEHYYGRKPTQTIYPPVEKKALASQKPTSIPNTFKEYLLVVSRFVPYKRIDLVIKAAQKLGKKLVIVGDGPDTKLLRAIAHSENILFLPPQSDQEIQRLMHHAQALVMPGIEDFGITALEAINQHTPAIIHVESGVAELIKDAKTGIHLQELSVNGLIEAIDQLEKTTFSTKEMSQLIDHYQTNKFKKNIQQLLTSLWKEHYGKFS